MRRFEVFIQPAAEREIEAAYEWLLANTPTNGTTTWWTRS